MLSKFIKKPAQKQLIFSIKASFERSLMYSGLNLIFYRKSKKDKSIASAKVLTFSKVKRTFFLKFAQKTSIGFKSGE